MSSLLSKELRSFRCAGRGLWAALRSDRHARLQLAFVLLALGLGFLLRLRRGEWIAVLLCCAAVLAAELLNTAVETVVDLASPARHPLAGKAKDIAAAAVLVTAIFAAIVGLLVFLPAARRLLPGA